MERPVFTFETRYVNGARSRPFVRRRLRLFSPFELSNNGRFLREERECSWKSRSNLIRYEAKKKKTRIREVMADLLVEGYVRKVCKGKFKVQLASFTIFNQANVG